jgi:SAM-dependent methyltransferase
VKALLRRLPGFRYLVLLRMLLQGGVQRHTAVSLITRPRNLFQPFTTTSAGRYPEEFAAIREALAGVEPGQVRILSFGCASGEEVVDLLKDFPQARITGIDLNPLALRAARRNVRAAGRAGRVTLLRAGDACSQPSESYDAVLAFAVLRHGELNHAPTTCAPTLRFADFEQTVTDLCRTVRPGGLFAIRHSNFRFTDCAAAADFEPVRTGFESFSQQGRTPVYGTEDQLLDVSMRDDGIYRRVPASRTSQ